MPLNNCALCGTLFYSYSGKRRCPECLEAEQEAFDTVVAYIRDSRERSIPRIAEATGVQRHLILRWIRQKRLRLEVVPGELDCRRCGAPIHEGSFCESCRRAMVDEIATQRELAGHDSSLPPAVRSKIRQRDRQETNRGHRVRRGMHYRTYTEGEDE